MWNQLSKLHEQGQRFILVTVISTGGSTPRNIGSQMVITTAKCYGSIGGGAIEYQVIQHAQDILAEQPNPSPISWFEAHLSHDLGMCCGGKMKLMLQDIVPTPRLIIFGAGHIGTALAQLAQFSGYQVFVIDDREEWADPHRFESVLPNNSQQTQSDRSITTSITVICNDAEHYLIGASLQSTDYVVVTTYDHGLDQRLISKLAPQKLAYLGLIGSKAKWLKFVSRLQDDVDPSDLDRVHCPMGLKIAAQTPEEIAVSVMAELISTRRNS